MTDAVLYVAATPAAAADGAAALERADPSLAATPVVTVEDVRQRAGDVDCVVFAETPTTDRGSHLREVLAACGETPIVLYSESAYGPAAARATEGVDGYVRRDGDRSAEHLADEIRWCGRTTGAAGSANDESANDEPGPVDLFAALPVPAVRTELDAESLRIEAVNDAFEATFGHGRAAADRTLPAALAPSQTESGEGVRERLLEGEPHRRTERRWTPDGVATFRVETVAVDRRAGTTALVTTFTDVTEGRRSRRALDAAIARAEAGADAADEGIDALDVAGNYLELARRTGDAEHLDVVADAHERLRDRLRSSAAGDDRASAEPVGLADVVRRAWSIVRPAEATLEVRDDLVFEAEKERLCEAFVALFGGWIEPGVVDRSVSITVDAQTDGFEIDLEGAAGATDAEPLKAVAGDRGWDLAIDPAPEEGSRDVRVAVEGVRVDDLDWGDGAEAFRWASPETLVRRSDPERGKGAEGSD